MNRAPPPPPAALPVLARPPAAQVPVEGPVAEGPTGLGGAVAVAAAPGGSRGC